MEGYIKIEAGTYEGRKGYNVESNFKELSHNDSMELLHCLCISTNIKPIDLRVMAALMESGVMDKVTDIEVVDASEDTMASLLKAILN